MPKTNPNERPLVYSCSGCSSAAQMANFLAVQIDRKGIGEMSCIAGVGGNVKKLVRTALSGREIIAIDGCPLACTRACLNNHSIAPTLHVVLSDHGVSKRQHQDFDKIEAEQMLSTIETQIRKWKAHQSMNEHIQTQSSKNEKNKS